MREERYLTKHECEHALAYLGYNRIETGNHGNEINQLRPRGCFVSNENGDDSTYETSAFNIYKGGRSGLNKYRSVCLNGGKFVFPIIQFTKHVFTIKCCMLSLIHI